MIGSGLREELSFELHLTELNLNYMSNKQKKRFSLLFEVVFFLQQEETYWGKKKKVFQ